LRCLTFKGENDERDREKLNERPFDGFGKNGDSAGQPIAEHPGGLATNRWGFTGGTLSKHTAVQAEKPIHVGSLQSTYTFEYKAGEL
jgi:hypothetical protein